MPSAKLGADVLGVDIASNLVEAGNKQTQEQGLRNCRFQEGDASALSALENKSFDLVVSMFGAMFAPKPFDVAKEMVRVTKPGGRIVMGNWIPNDPTLVAQILKISSSYSPPPPEGFISPMTWGVESNVVERFTAAGVPKENITCTRDTYTFNYPGRPVEFKCLLACDRIRIRGYSRGEHVVVFEFARGRLNYGGHQPDRALRGVGEVVIDNDVGAVLEDHELDDGRAGRTQQHGLHAAELVVRIAVHPRAVEDRADHVEA